MDTDLVNQIYTQYAKEIYFYLLTLSKNSYMAEDILQEVFFKAICSLPDSHMNIRAWLYRVAKNTFLNEIKKEKRKISLEEIPEISHPDTLLSKVLQSEEERLLYRGIQELPERQRRILILQFFSGWSVREIALDMRISAENVRVLAHRGRKQLKEFMEVNGYEVS